MTARESWGSRVGLVLAMAGNAVGLGNFLRFPAQAAQNGGGAFLIPYLVCFALMGIPLLWVEWAIGRHGGRFGHHSAPGMFDRLGKRRWLKYVGIFGLFTNLTVAAYYCYIESWTLAYVFHSVTGTFADVEATKYFPEYLGVHEGSLFSVPPQALFWFLLTLTLNVFVLSRGLSRGVELVAKIGVPMLIVFGALLALRGLLLSPGSDAGVVESPLVGLNFVWEPQLSGLTNPATWLAAAGQIFFTLSVGMGSIHCYASYLKEKDDIALNAASAGWMNEFVEIVLGGSVILPIATAYLGLESVRAATAGGSGFGLGFLTLPTLFGHWGWLAPIAGAMWFGLLFVAGLTSSLAMGQPVLAFLEDELGVKREKAALLFGLSTLVLGFWCVWLYPGGAFDEFDFWTGTVSLVALALCESLIFAFVFGMDKGWEELTRGAELQVPRIFRFIIQWVTPSFIVVIFVSSLIKPDVGWGEAFSALASGDGWPLAVDSVIGKVLHVGDTTGWFDAAGHGTKVLVQDLSRLLLSLIFLGCGALIWHAWKQKEAAR